MSNLLITLCVGLIIGYAAQRSRFCLIGGVRDYMIVKDKYLLKGMFALLITAALLFLALHLLGVHQENMKNYPMFIKDTTDQQVIEASACANTKPLYLFLKKAGGLKFNRWGARCRVCYLGTAIQRFILPPISYFPGNTHHINYYTIATKRNSIIPIEIERRSFSPGNNLRSLSD